MVILVAVYVQLEDSVTTLMSSLVSSNLILWRLPQQLSTALNHRSQQVVTRYIKAVLLWDSLRACRFLHLH